MADIKWLEGNRIQIAPPKRTKKITGTRFATILGLNPWSTAFEMWCAITKTYEKPFEDTIYTVAGKTIEPKQARYIRGILSNRPFYEGKYKYGDMGWVQGVHSPILPLEV